MLSWIAKYLGIKAIKLSLKKLIMAQAIEPLVENAGDYAQEFVNDPDTTADEEFVEKAEELIKWMAQKKLNQLFD